MPPKKSCEPLHHHFWTNCHPTPPPGACLCVSLALGLLLKTCCSSFTKRGSEQFYTPFDLCSGIRSSLRLPSPGKKCTSSNPALLHSHRASAWVRRGQAGADPRSWVSSAVTWRFLLDFLSRGPRPRTSVTETFTGGLSYDQRLQSRDSPWELGEQPFHLPSRPFWRSHRQRVWQAPAFPLAVARAGLAWGVTRPAVSHSSWQQDPLHWTLCPGSDVDFDWGMVR